MVRAVNGMFLDARKGALEFYKAAEPVPDMFPKSFQTGVTLLRKRFGNLPNRRHVQHWTCAESCFMVHKDEKPAGPKCPICNGDFVPAVSFPLALSIVDLFANPDTAKGLRDMQGKADRERQPGVYGDAHLSDALRRASARLDRNPVHPHFKDLDMIKVFLILHNDGFSASLRHVEGTAHIICATVLSLPEHMRYVQRGS